MSEQNVTSTMREMMAELATVRAELASLQQRTQNLLPPDNATVAPVSVSPSKITGTRRKTLKRLGLALLGGVAAATATGYSSVQAKLVANPGTSKVGAIVLAPTTTTTGTANSSYSYGLVGVSPINTNDSPPFALSNLPQGDTGVFGTSRTYGVYGSSGYSGVYGQGGAVGVNGDGISYGLYGTGGVGVYGASSKSYGVGVYGNAQAAGVFIGNSGGGGSALPIDTTVGVIGSVGTNLDLSTIPGSSTIGIYGIAPTSSNNYAGYFKGNVYVSKIGSFGGSITAEGNIYAPTFTGGNKTFKIDHPLDPANKYLYHTSIESPDMMNLYNGIATLDELGEATITMPDWFEALNTDFRYQLTSIGVSMPELFIAEEIKDLKFKIAGGKPDQRVSWQVTGIRQDAFARTYRTPVEQDKTDSEKGKYLHPELYGQPEEMAVNYRSVEAATK